ncbi:MAG: hypothetical protein PF505_13415 [Vallitaleaceae bacterium]|jgi:hypothetical protein|nr:hypothetical protein [Vallitaleaceae bacterium]
MASVGLPYYEDDLQSGLLNTDAFENLLYNGEAFTYTNSIPYIGDTTITIVPHE